MILNLRPILVLALVLALAITAASAADSFASRTYTDNTDFDEGSAINVTHSVPGQLQLDDTTQAFNFIWVAVSTKGTAVKIDINTGEILGEYLTAPDGRSTDPSRTTVDKNGNVWVTNRAESGSVDGTPMGSLVHIGLEENGQCVDRNGNGFIDTSTGQDDILDWANTGSADDEGGVSTAGDECILHYVRVHSTGTRHVSVNANNDVWISGTGIQDFDLVDGDTGAIITHYASVGYGGYGGLIDPNGVIWSARPLLRWDTALPLTGPIGGNWDGYGHDSYGLCIDSLGNVWNTALGGNTIYKFAPDGTLTGTFSHGNYYAQGCVADENDDIWVAHSLIGGATVGHLKNNGTYVGNVDVGSGPTGVAVDANGKIWATNYNSGTVSRIDPTAGPIGADGVTPVGAVDFTTVGLGGSPYNYSDMTGSTLIGAPDNGTWSVVYDSGIDGAEWGKTTWTADVPGDGSLTVAVSSSNDGSTFGPAEAATDGADLTVDNGRYLRVTVSFGRASTGASPILYDLTVSTAGEPPAATATPTPSPTAVAEVVALPRTGGTPSDGGGLPWLALAAGVIAITSGGLVLAYQRRRIR